PTYGPARVLFRRKGILLHESSRAIADRVRLLGRSSGKESVMNNQPSAPALGPMSRRSLLQIGGLACLGLEFVGIFRGAAPFPATPRQAAKARLRSCILIFCDGGPSHIDPFHMKPDAPAGARRECPPIAPRVPGARACV